MFKGAPWVGQHLTEYRLNKMGSAFKDIGIGELAYNLK
jgi:hypothetical protein